MGAGTSKNQPQHNRSDLTTTQRSKLQNLIHEEQLEMQMPQLKDQIQNKQHGHNPVLQRQQRQQTMSKTIPSDSKISAYARKISNFGKLRQKTQHIRKLNQMLNEQILQLQHEKQVKELVNEQQKSSKKQSNEDGQVVPKRLPFVPKKRKVKKTQIQSVFMGIWIGITLCIVILLIVIININNLSISNQSQFSRDFPTWRGICIWIFYLWMIGFDITMFQKKNIRYREIFKLQKHHYPHPVNIFKIAGFHSSIFALLFLFYVLDIAGIYHIPGFAQQYFALISWGLFVLFLVFPFPTFSHKGRFFAFSLFLDAIMSPFKGVTFPVIWMTDQAVSMAIPLKDLQYTICYYTELDFKSQNNVCADNNRVSAVMVVAVSICIIRMIQCFRQGYDKGEFWLTPFMFNTIKYFVTLLTAVFAFVYKLGDSQIQIAWIFFAIVSSLYSFTWDVKMDWDLMQPNQPNRFLRAKLEFGSPKVYYCIMIGNFFMRLTWIITISPKLAAFIGNTNLVFLVTGLIEIFRRGVWNLIRVEKEHVGMADKPPEDEEAEQNVLQMEKKFQSVQNSLNLQMKLLKFFKKFESNRVQLKANIKNVKLDTIHMQKQFFDTYNKKFQQEELREISGLIEQILVTDPLLKKKVEQQVGSESKEYLRSDTANSSNKQNPNEPSRSQAEESKIKSKIEKEKIERRKSEYQMKELERKNSLKKTQQEKQFETMSPTKEQLREGYILGIQEISQHEEEQDKHSFEHQHNNQEVQSK